LDSDIQNYDLFFFMANPAHVIAQKTPKTHPEYTGLWQVALAHSCFSGAGG
jgi:hypothetical protein